MSSALDPRFVDPRTADPGIEELDKLLRRSDRAMELLSDLLLSFRDLAHVLVKQIRSGQLLPLDTTTVSGGNIAHNLLIFTNELNGRCQFSFDLHKDKFALPPQLEQLLIFLSSADASELRSGTDMDGLLGWRSRESILAHLQKSSRRTLRPGYANAAVSKLKLMLKDLDGRTLIVTHAEKGARLALKRGGVHYQLD
jgi:hypothetical protein